MSQICVISWAWSLTPLCKALPSSSFLSGKYKQITLLAPAAYKAAVLAHCILFLKGLMLELENTLYLLQKFDIFQGVAS